MPLNFKRFNIPWRKPVTRKTTEESIQARKTREIVAEQVEQTQLELEDIENLNDLSRIKEQQINIEAQSIGLENEANRLEGEAAVQENERRARQNEFINGSLATTAQIAAQAIRYNVSTIGTRTGNTIKQERLQRSLSGVTQGIGIAIGAVVNPLLGVSAFATFAANVVIRDQQTRTQRERITKDNEMRLQLLGGISQRGNR